MIKPEEIEKLAEEYYKTAFEADYVTTKQTWISGFQKCLELLNAHEKTRVKDLLEISDLKAQIKYWEDKEGERAVCCYENEKNMKIAVEALKEISDNGTSWVSIVASQALEKIGEP